MAKLQEAQSREMKDGDWNEILASIEREKCILILGPGAIVDVEENSLHDKLCKFIANELGIDIPDTPEKLFQLADKLTEQRGWRKLLSNMTEDVYEQEEIHSIYSLLAQIPFHLILSTSPGMTLPKAFDKQGLNFQFDYYNYKEKHELELVPNKDVPLLYNLFGKLKDEDSLVLTHESLLDFIFSILSAKSFPRIIKEKVVTATNFLYLGFDFESWYLKILLKLFESEEVEISYAHAWHFQRLRPNTQEFYQKTFSIDFIQMDFIQFITELHQRCETEGILKEEGTAQEEQSGLQQVSAMIKKGKIDGAIDFLEKFAESEDDIDLLKSVVGLSQRYNKLVGSKLKGTITQENEEVENNQIVQGLLNLAELIDEAA